MSSKNGKADAAEYVYTDENGERVFRVVRRPDKHFFMERWKDGKWVKGVDGVKRPLYNAQAVAAAGRKVVWLTEGERDADALNDLGLIATTNSGGAGKWRDEYSHELLGARYLNFVYDNDEKGRAHALQVEASLKACGVSVRMMRAKEGKDATDHLAAGYTIAQFVRERPQPSENAKPPGGASKGSAGAQSVSPGAQTGLEKLLGRLTMYAHAHNRPPPLVSGDGWDFSCPSHDDSNPSLSVKAGAGDEQPVVLHCQAGCETEDVLKAIGLTWKDVMADRPSGGSSWQPIDVAEIVAGIASGEIVGPVPTLLARNDGQCLLYPGEVHSISGEPETGKGWISLEAIAEVIESGHKALYLDFEDRAASIIGRLLARGVTADTIVEQFMYVRPCDPFAKADLEALLEAGPFRVVVLDGLTEAYALLGLNPMSNEDAPKFLAALPRPFADDGAAVLEVDHVSKDRETRGRYAIGAQHKLAGIAVAYSTQTLKTFSRRQSGTVKVKLNKDRHGHIGRRGVIALVNVVPQDGGRSVVVSIEPPDSLSEGGEFRPTALMERTSRVIEETPGLTMTHVRECVKGNDAAGRQALKILLEEGYLRTVPRGKQALLHYSVKPFREGG